MKKQAVQALFCGLFLGGLSCGEDRGSLEQRVDEIIGGTSTTALPAVGLITYDGYAHCTGTLIEPRKVLTAARCLSGLNLADLAFAIGASTASVQQVIAASSVEPHPNFHLDTARNDIGLLYLEEEAPASPLGINRVPMDSTWVGKKLIFVGYGSSNGYSGTGDGVKRYVSMPIASVGSTTFTYGVEGKNTCAGDSGAPAFAQDGNGNLVVAGVTSYGDRYCTSYGVDTRVDAFLEFVGVKLPPADPCQGETVEGRCNGNVLIWCENQQLKQYNCASAGKVCGRDSANNFYACLAPTDPCQGETYEGRCDGNTLIWCESSQVRSLSCKKKCGWDAAKSYYNCL